MSPPTVHTGRVEWFGIVAVLVVGTAVVTYGYLWDRATNRRRNEALNSPPDRPIPGLTADAEPPTYVLPQSLNSQPAMTASALSALRARLDATAPLPYGHGKGAFATDHKSGLAALDHPLILIVEGELTSMRELLAVTKKASQAGRPLVVVAARLSNEVFQTLETNALAKTLACVGLAISEQGQRAELAAMTGASPLAISDLKMGWVPDASLGSCTTWVSSPDQSWLLAES